MTRPQRPARIACALIVGACALAACGDESRREEIRAEALRGDAERFAQQAAVQIVAGNHEQAGILARRAIQADPGYARGHHMLAWSALHLGQQTVPVVAAHEAVRLAPDSATYRRTLGIALQDAGRLREAEDAYRRAVAMNPADTLSWIDLARVAYANGNYLRADSAFDALAELVPSYFDSAAADARLRAGAARAAAAAAG